jgi:hypothetical protein
MPGNFCVGNHLEFRKGRASENLIADAKGSATEYSAKMLNYMTIPTSVIRP